MASWPTEINRGAVWDAPAAFSTETNICPAVQDFFEIEGSALSGMLVY